MADSSDPAVRRRLKTDGSSNGEAIGSVTKQPARKASTPVASAAVAGTILSPAIFMSLAFILGGCCGNVYAMEAIVALSPAAGTLVTFLQFSLTALFSLRSQLTFQSSNDPKSESRLFPRLRPRIIPLTKWIIYTSFFLTINVLNNVAFKYRISIPLHIILRSAGPVSSMIVGYTVGKKRYTTRQVVAVFFLFVGVVLAAMSDARAKSQSRPNVPAPSSAPTPALEVEKDEWSETPTQAIMASMFKTSTFAEQTPGFLLLFAALILSAVMGLYTDRLYEQYGRSTDITYENIFYSHTLSLPFFAIQARTLSHEFQTLVQGSTASSLTRANSAIPSFIMNALAPVLPYILPHIPVPTALKLLALINTYSTPVTLLLLNAFTQIICITGVHHLSTQTTSLTVTIVLNIKKLVSLVLSIWLFGNSLPLGVAVGGAIVFFGGGLYGWKGKTKSKDTPPPTTKSIDRSAESRKGK